MSPEFVRYTPEIETIDPHIDELLAQIVAFWEKKGHESPTTEGTGRAVRGEHAKSFGLVKAEVEILADVPSAHAQASMPSQAANLRRTGQRRRQPGVDGGPEAGGRMPLAAVHPQRRRATGPRPRRTPGPRTPPRAQRRPPERPRR